MSDILNEVNIRQNLTVLADVYYTKCSCEKSKFSLPYIVMNYIIQGIFFLLNFY